jgi:hypothetical protein
MFFMGGILVKRQSPKSSSLLPDLESGFVAAVSVSAGIVKGFNQPALGILNLFLNLRDSAVPLSQVWIGEG